MFTSENPVFTRGASPSRDEYNKAILGSEPKRRPEIERELAFFDDALGECHRLTVALQDRLAPVITQVPGNMPSSKTDTTTNSAMGSRLLNYRIRLLEINDILDSLHRGLEL